MEKNQKIHCDVESCKHINDDCEYCTLKEIKVSCTCDPCECEECESTMCASYESEEE